METRILRFAQERRILVLTVSLEIDRPFDTGVEHLVRPSNSCPDEYPISANASRILRETQPRWILQLSYDGWGHLGKGKTIFSVLLNKRRRVDRCLPFV